MQQELASRLAAYDESVSSDATKLKRWLNMAQQFISGKNNWSFLLGNEIIQTVTDYTTGTVATVSGSTSITFSGTVAISRANHFIKTSDSADWYQITAHTAGSASATITPAATTTNTVATFTTRKLFYTSITPLRSLLDMKRHVSPGTIESVSPRIADIFLPLRYDTGTPYEYIQTVPDSSGNIQFSLLYAPSSVMNIQVRGIKNLSDMSADSDTSLIPGAWHDAIVARAAYYGFHGLDDTRSQEAKMEADERIDDLSRVYNTDLGRLRVMRPVDASNTIGPVFSLPGNFGPETYR